VVYEHPVRQARPNIDAYPYEVRILGLQTRQERTLVSGAAPAWSPSGEWISYFPDADRIAIVHPD
jgi:hypothetical protein